MKKPTVAVVFGSRSTEHDVSIVTAIASVIKPLELSQKYTVVAVYIDKQGRWFAGDAFKQISLYRSDGLEAVLKAVKPVSVLFGDGLTLVHQKSLRRVYQKIDVVFPALHGTHGEDGEVMALCELANVPYVGCDVPASVLAMDKVLAKQTAIAAGIATPAYCAFGKTEYEQDAAGWVTRINKTLTYPVFVKPAHLGSSIGITRVTDPKQLANAIEVALHYDTKALVEEGVHNLTEVTLPIIGNDDPIPSLLEQPLTHGEDFFDFETKYMQGGKKGKGGAKTGKQGAQGYSKLPAELPAALYAAAEQTGLAVYKALGCSGIARVDMLIDSKAQKIYFNEVNPLPGSLYAHNWRQKGISNVQLVTKLIEYAQQRHVERQAANTVFTTSFLKQF